MKVTSSGKECESTMFFMKNGIPRFAGPVKKPPDDGPASHAMPGKGGGRHGQKPSDPG